MLCEIQMWGSLYSTWLAMTLLAFVMIMGMSGLIFAKYYAKPTYEQWRTKTNPRYPSPEKVREEVVQTMKGMAMATFCPALSLFLSQSGYSQAYCGFSEYGVGYHVATFMLIWIGSDFWEFYYHRLGHTTSLGWVQHKHHHVFHNPSPFAVIADEWIDQFFRSLPLLLFPVFLPINMDMMFFTYGAFFYAYGVYLHWGHELQWPDAHHPWLNTAFQHYCHHAVSIKNKPYHTGFFFKAWDQMFGSVWDKECFCAKCECAKGNRSLEAWKEVQVPDYNCLLRPSFWLSGLTEGKQA